MRTPLWTRTASSVLSLVITVLVVAGITVALGRAGDWAPAERPTPVSGPGRDPAIVGGPRNLPRESVEALPESGEDGSSDDDGSTDSTGSDDESGDSQTDGSQSNGSQSDGSQSDGSQSDGSQSDGSQSDGSQSDDNGSGDSQSGGSQSDDDASDGSRSESSQAVSSQAVSSQSVSSQSVRSRSESVQPNPSPSIRSPRALQAPPNRVRASEASVDAVDSGSGSRANSDAKDSNESDVAVAAPRRVDPAPPDDPRRLNFPRFVTGYVANHCDEDSCNDVSVHVRTRVDADCPCYVVTIDNRRAPAGDHVVGRGSIVTFLLGTPCTRDGTVVAASRSDVEGAAAEAEQIAKDQAEAVERAIKRAAADKAAADRAAAADNAAAVHVVTTEKAAEEKAAEEKAAEEKAAEEKAADKFAIEKAQAGKSAAVNAAEEQPAGSTTGENSTAGQTADKEAAAQAEAARARSSDRREAGGRRRGYPVGDESACGCGREGGDRWRAR